MIRAWAMREVQHGFAQQRCAQRGVSYEAVHGAGDTDLGLQKTLLFSEIENEYI
jgi:ribosomal protein L5